MLDISLELLYFIAVCWLNLRYLAIATLFLLLPLWNTQKERMTEEGKKKNPDPFTCEI